MLFIYKLTDDQPINYRYTNDREKKNPCLNLFVLDLCDLHKAEFQTKCRLIKERMESKESEVNGKWLTAEAMKKSAQYTAKEIKAITSYCRKFPESLVR